MQAPASAPESIMTAPLVTAAQHATAPALSRGQSSLRWRWLGLALLSGATLYLCHFPVAWGWLAWVALVPVLTLARIQTRGWWLFLCAWSCGLGYYLPAVSWMSAAHPAMIACWIILSLYCALYFPLALWLVRKLEGGTRLPLMLTFPVVWTALEFVRVYFMTGFSWYLLAHTQHNVLPVIQIADLGGAFAVSFLVAVVNVVAFEGSIRWAAVPWALGLDPSAKVLLRRGFFGPTRLGGFTAGIHLGLWILVPGIRPFRARSASCPVAG